MTCDTPSADTDRSSSMPLIVFTASSIAIGHLGLDLLGRRPWLARRNDDGREVHLRIAIERRG